MMDLRQNIERVTAPGWTGSETERRAVFDRLRAELNTGSVRAAERGEDGVWRVNAWVKAGILLGFRLGRLTRVAGGGWPFFDNDTWPVRSLDLADGVRLVPGGSSVRDGCYLAPGVVCMPPMYINAGAFVDEDTLVDSHALIGSCAQIGKRVHISAGAQIGGVLEPVGELPVIIEDDVLVGGNCGVYEGTIVQEGAVLAAGTILTGSTVVVDLVRNRTWRRAEGRPLEIPAGAVVVPGTRPVRSGPGAAAGIALATPVIVKYRDERTDAATRLEELLRATGEIPA
jgi:2,3,4,5-tetrahydropyridine-2,6-dicarboxylate N-succinyltransferase